MTRKSFLLVLHVRPPCSSSTNAKIAFVSQGVACVCRRVKKTANARLGLSAAQPPWMERRPKAVCRLSARLVFAQRIVLRPMSVKPTNAPPSSKRLANPSLALLPVRSAILPISPALAPHVFARLMHKSVRRLVKQMQIVLVVRVRRFPLCPITPPKPAMSFVEKMPIAQAVRSAKFRHAPTARFKRNV
jgi:hypothetical protein